MSLVPFGQVRELRRQVADLQTENDFLRRRVQALEHERAWEHGWLTAKCDEVRAMALRVMNRAP